MDDRILESMVDKACNNLAEHGIDSVTDKDVVLACFGAMAFNGLAGIKKELMETRQLIWKVAQIGLSVMLTAVVSIILTVIFIL